MYRTLDLDQLHPNPAWPARPADSLLAALVEDKPPIARPRPDAAGLQAELVTGRAHYELARRLGTLQLCVDLRDDLPDAAAQALARDSLAAEASLPRRKPLAIADALCALKDSTGLSDAELGKRLRIPRHQVTQYRRLAQLDPEVREVLEAGDISLGHARALASLPRQDQRALAARIRREGLSVRATEEAAMARHPERRRLVQRPDRRAGEGGPPDDLLTPSSDPDIARLEAEYSVRFGHRIRVQTAPDGGGALIIAFADLGEFDVIAEKLGLVTSEW